MSPKSNGNPNGRYRHSKWVWLCPQCGKRVKKKHDRIITFYRGWKLIVHYKCKLWIDRRSGFSCER